MTSSTSVVGTPTWAGLDNYRELLKDSRFWESFRHSVAMVAAMAMITTAIGLVVAAILFDFIGRHFGSKLARSRDDHAARPPHPALDHRAAEVALIPAPNRRTPGGE